MALTHTRVSEAATEAQEIADQLKAVYQRTVAFLATNSDLSIDWAAGALPSYINEDVDGNLDGLGFTRAQVANIVGSFDQFKNLIENAAVTQGDHLGNINQLSSVKV